MKLSDKAETIYDQITSVNAKLGDLRQIAKTLKKDHPLAVELWSTGEFHPRMLAILLFDPKELNLEVVDQLLEDISITDQKSYRNQLTDWLMANQLLKIKKLIPEIETWAEDATPVKRRIFWYYQGRLRWMGKPSPENTPRMVELIEKKLHDEHPDVQWAMNFTAGWIGIYNPQYRDRLIALGENLGLFKDEMISKNCTPNYLPEFIRIEVGKRGG